MGRVIDGIDLGTSDLRRLAAMRKYGCYLGAAVVLMSAVMAAGFDEKDEPRIRVGGAVENATDWTVDGLLKELAADVKEIRYTTKGQEATARAIPLHKLVTAAKPKLDPKQKNHQLAFVLVVRADDGYTASFSLGELMPEWGGAEVYIAFDRDGQPLPKSAQPATLIVPGDKKPSRWVHGIKDLTLVDCLAAVSTK
jgi:hypothetical protein